MGGESLELTRREFELLQVLADHGGKVLERDEIYQRVWGYAMIHGDRSVDVFVRKLRSKLQKRSPGWEYIHTHFGIGYRFDPQPIGADGRARAREPLEAPPSASADARPTGARPPPAPDDPRVAAAWSLGAVGGSVRACSAAPFTRLFTSWPPAGNRCPQTRWDAPARQLRRSPSEVISRKSILAVFCCGVLALGVAACGSSSSSSSSSASAVTRSPARAARSSRR